MKKDYLILITESVNNRIEEDNKKMGKLKIQLPCNFSVEQTITINNESDLDISVMHSENNEAHLIE